MRSLVSVRAVTGAVILAATLSGCTVTDGPVDSSETGSSAATAGTGVEKNRMQWSMPLDTYTIPGKYGYVTHVLVEPCMRENGFAYDRPDVDVTRSSPTMSASERSLFNTETAAQWGYGSAPDPDVDKIRAAQADATTWSPEQHEQFSACTAQAREVLPEDWARIDSTVASIGMSAWTGAKSAPEVVAAAQEWVRCMQPLGFSDLPSSPNSDDGGMPTDAMAATFGWVTDGMEESQTPEQQAEEIRIATFDAECQESSGYADALYEAEWSRQVSIVEDNEDALARLLEEKAAYLARVDEVMREAGLG
ncbi:hypothetical protein GCM10023113_04180 [Cellulomonas oligotrophica]